MREKYGSSEDRGNRGAIARFMYRVGWIFFRAMFKTFWRLRIIGLQNLPKNTGVIIAANHTSYSDPPLIGACITSPIFYFAKKELFDFPLFGWVLRNVNAFPVDRTSAGITAIKTAHRIIKENKILLMFPQGGRKSEDDFEFKNGIGILSCMTGAPIVPCFVLNSNKLVGFKRLVVRFLPPIFPPTQYDRSTYESLARKTIEQIKHASLPKEECGDQ